MKRQLKQCYKEMLLNKHYKPYLWLEKDIFLRKQKKELERQSRLSDAELDIIFEEARKEALEEIA